MEFRHPQTGQAIRFLPPDSGIGTLVKVAVSEYIRYFNALKQGALPQPQATKEQVAQVEVSHSKIDGDEANDNDACRRR